MREDNGTGGERNGENTGGTLCTQEYYFPPLNGKTTKPHEIAQKVIGLIIILEEKQLGTGVC